MMDTPTYEPNVEPDRTPRPSPIVDAPATPAACAEDYADAAGVRLALDKQLR
ncbi:hypothetical protein VWBp23 [Streptomyces phage VWB]|uniref:Uncharacterized protein n=1 Tax=Streptomyces phage VWB TaxID=10702 RepID=Q6VY66_9CAUD|nr:hypothetical protein VWBp23 [Streptomyces phage VWB]AAR29713.1 hypothetical protein [Streptomyces phage VWB]